MSRSFLRACTPAPLAAFPHPRARWLVLLALGVALHGGRVRAAENAPAPMIEMEAQFVRATAAQMRAALGAPPSGSAASILSAPRLQTALATLKSSKAVFFSYPRAITKSGQPATVQTVRELRYPTEFDPSVDQPGKHRPVAFETRNVGVTIKFEPTVTAGGALDVHIAASVVTFLGFIDYTSEQRPKANQTDALEELLKGPLTEGGIWQPIFTTEQVQTSVAVSSNQTVLLGLPSSIPKPPLANDLQAFVFITVRAVTAD